MLTVSKARRNDSFRFTRREAQVKQRASIRTQTQKMAPITKKAMTGWSEKRSVLPKIREISMPRNGESVKDVKMTIREVSAAKRLLIRRTFGMETIRDLFWIVVTGCQM